MRPNEVIRLLFRADFCHVANVPWCIECTRCMHVPRVIISEYNYIYEYAVPFGTRIVLRRHIVDRVKATDENSCVTCTNIRFFFGQRSVRSLYRWTHRPFVSNARSTLESDRSSPARFHEIDRGILVFVFPRKVFTLRSSW